MLINYSISMQHSRKYRHDRHFLHCPFFALTKPVMSKFSAVNISPLVETHHHRISNVIVIFDSSLNIFNDSYGECLLQMFILARNIYACSPMLPCCFRCGATRACLEQRTFLSYCTLCMNHDTSSIQVYAADYHCGAAAAAPAAVAVVHHQ